MHVGISYHTGGFINTIRFISNTQECPATSMFDVPGIGTAGIVGHRRGVAPAPIALAVGTSLLQDKTSADGGGGAAHVCRLSRLLATRVHFNDVGGVERKTSGAGAAAPDSGDLGR